MDFKEEDYTLIKVHGNTPPHVTGYRDVTHFPYKGEFDATLNQLTTSIKISVDHTSYFDTREMYALLKISGASDNSNPGISVSRIITGIK